MLGSTYVQYIPQKTPSPQIYHFKRASDKLFSRAKQFRAAKSGTRSNCMGGLVVEKVYVGT